MLKCLIFLCTCLIFSAFAEETPVPNSGITLDDTISSSIMKIVERVKETKGKIAIMDFPGLDGRMTGLSAYINNKVGNRFIFAGRQVVDRSTLEKVIDEQKLQQNALVDATTAARVGKLAGAGVFIIGNYTKTDSKFSLTIRALSVESAQFIPGAVAEDTVMNLSESYTKELNELINMGVAKSSSGGLAPSEQNSKFSVAMGKAELEFNKKVCSITQGDRRFPKVIKAAFDTGYIEINELKSIDLFTSIYDVTGERHLGHDLGLWSFSEMCNPVDTGKYIKGKDLSKYSDCQFSEWLYKGEPFPGIEKCIQKLNWWTGKK